MPRQPINRAVRILPRSLRDVIMDCGKIINFLHLRFQTLFIKAELLAYFIDFNTTSGFAIR